jgi:hypothetical protein
MNDNRISCADAACSRAQDGHFHVDPDAEPSPSPQLFDYHEPPREMELAERLYNAYGEARGWKTFSGGVMPRWYENKDAGVLAGWRAAAAEAVNAIQGSTREATAAAQAFVYGRVPLE